jgi:excisionase family DNA binding protein
MEIEKHYTVSEAAELLGTDQETILAWIHNGNLTAVNVSRQLNCKRPSWRIAESELGRTLLSRRSLPKPLPTPKTTTKRKRLFV